MREEFQDIELNQFIKREKLSDEVLKALSLVLESMAEGVNVSNDKGVILYTNPAFDVMFGYHQGALIGKHISDLTTYSAEENAQLYKEINQILDTQKVWSGEFSNKKKDCTVFYTETQISAVELRGKRCLISVQSDITQRKMMETSLQESETKYRIVSENTYDWGYWISPEKKFIYLSPSCKRITGYDTDEFLADPNLIYRIIHPEDQPIFAGHITEAEKQLHSDEIEFRIIRKDGTVRSIGHVCQPVFDRDGNFLGTRASNRDLTKRKFAEEALLKSEEKYRTVADFTYDWEDWLDPSGKYIYMSPSCEWITGYHRDELLDMDMVLKITHPDDRELVKKHFHEVLSGSIEIHHMDFRIITRSGDERWISHYCQPVYNKKGTYLGRRGSNRDITERKQSEQKLKQLTDELKRYNVELQSVNDKLKAEIEVRERMQKALELSEERYKKMVDTVTSYTYSVQVRKGNAIYTEHSIGCLPITGYNPEDYKSDTHLWYSMIYPDDKMAVENTIKEIMAGKKVLPIEHRIIRRDGAIIWIRNTIVPYYNDDEALLRYEGLIEDITERKIAEEEIQKLNKELEQKLLELTEANKELEAFNRSVSHDLQTPLMVIGGFARRFLKVYGDTLDAEAIGTIHTIQMSAQKMERLIKDILAFSRSGRQEIKPVQIDMKKLVSIVLEELKPLFEGRTINFEIKALSPAYGDIPLIKQVLVNLISNAVKFTQSKDMAVIEVGNRVEGNKNIYYVKDNGIGFDSQHTDKLFAPFNRLPEAKEFDGTGIGLSIVERIINRHGERVWAEGKINEGATFYFSMPKNV